MDNLTLKKWLKEIKKYYKCLVYIKTHNYKGKPVVQDDFFGRLIKVNDIMLIAPKIYLDLYVGIYCNGKTIKDLAKELGYSRAHLHRLIKKFEEYLLENLNERIKIDKDLS